MSVSTDTPFPCSSAVDYCRNRISHFCVKADHNKREALVFFSAAMAFSLAAPLFITLGKGDIFGKVIPAVLSTMSAGATAWLQQRKPHQLWSLYRTAQRELENELVQHEFLLDRYSQSASSDKQLAERVAEICLRAHTLWVPIVPSQSPAAQKGNEVVKATNTNPKT